MFGKISLPLIFFSNITFSEVLDFLRCYIFRSRVYYEILLWFRRVLARNAIQTNASPVLVTVTCPLNRHDTLWWRYVCVRISKRTSNALSPNYGLDESLIVRGISLGVLSMISVLSWRRDMYIHRASRNSSCERSRQAYCSGMLSSNKISLRSTFGITLTFDHVHCELHLVVISYARINVHFNF